MNAELVFPEAWQLDGFTTNVTSRQAGEPDPVVRELLQNCLDAAVREADREYAEIHFTIGARSLLDLPGYAAYVQAFEAAKNEVKRPATHDVLSAIRRIEQVLGKQEMNILFCRDNGVGLNPNRMSALLSEGQSDKARHGAGSYGLGHLTAYAASDLRYVLYAGRRGDYEIASGHTILASHKRGQIRHSAHGFWRTPTDFFSLEDGNFPTVVPEIMRSQMDRISTSGTIVAIAGFNFFHEDDQSNALYAICRVAALNFLGAIWEGKMIVHVHDEDSGRTETVDRAALHRLLATVQNQQRAPHAGWLPGEQGYRSLQTLNNGYVLDAKIDRSIKVYFRSLGANSSERTRVQIFRDGMWITNRAPELGPGAFGGVRPFDAVVLLSDADPEDHTEFYDLVRNSEGPEHRDLTKLRALPNRDRTALRTMFRTLAARLREEAGSLDTKAGFTPLGFALFGGDMERVAERIRRPVRQPEDGSQDSGKPGGEEVEVGPPPERPGTRTPRQTARRGPSPGRALMARSSVVPQTGSDGKVRRLSAELRVDEKLGPKDRLVLRVRVQSGSDATCDQPLPDSWLELSSVEVDGRSVDAGGEFDVEIPHDAGRMTISLKESLPDTVGVALDVVRRRSKHLAEA